MKRLSFLFIPIIVFNIICPEICVYLNLCCYCQNMVGKIDLSIYHFCSKESVVPLSHLMSKILFLYPILITQTVYHNSLGSSDSYSHNDLRLSLKMAVKVLEWENDPPGG